MSALKHLIIVVAVVAVLSGGYVLSRPDRTVDVVRPARMQAVQAVYATGTVEAGTMLPIAPRISARLAELNVDEGSTVKKDEILARLEDTDQQQTLLELKAKAALAERNYQRKNSLRGTGAISREAIDQAQTERAMASAAVKRAEAELGYLSLSAPADGVIIRRDGEVGELIPANQAVFWIACCSALRVEAEVDEEDISIVRPGQRVLLTADAFPGRTFEGHVQSITPKGDPVARSYRVRIVTVGKTPLMIGMTAEANIITRTKDNALMVPRSAIAGGLVWVVKDGLAKRQPVRTGITAPAAVEILEGLDEQALVIADPVSDALQDGGRLNPVLQDWPGE